MKVSNTSLDNSDSSVDNDQDGLFDYFYNNPGSSPGTLRISPQAIPTEITLIDYNQEQTTCISPITPEECIPYLDTESVSWIDVQGLGSEGILRQVGQIFQLPLLLLEDIVNVPHRPKIEIYPNHLLVITQMVMPKRRGGFWIEQVSLILGKQYLLTVQEEPERDSFNPVRQHIRNNIGTIRCRGADYLFYALWDAVIDGYFPVLELYGEQIEDLEDEIVQNPTDRTLNRIYRIRRDLLALRRAIWPQRDALNSLIRDGNPLVNPEILSFLRDCYDHIIQIIDMIETYRELASGLMDVYLSAISNKLNDIMKVLTIISTIFIPLTFIVGVYGMNFNTEKSPFNMPELNWYWGYPLCWALMLTIASTLFYFFWRRGWFKSVSTLRRSSSATMRKRELDE